jgi:hypothetical protein
MPSMSQIGDFIVPSGGLALLSLQS